MTSAVEGRDLVLRYGARTALGESTFEVQQGEIAALIGPNGSGKSTLLNAIAGLQPIAAGTLRIFGGIPMEARPRLSYVLQATKVNETLPVTVREVVTMGRFARLGMFRPLRTDDRAAVKTALDRLGISDLAGRQLSELSGGQRQRAFVAQGLAQDHDLLLLDEPLTGLDLVSTQVIAMVLAEERAAGGTVLMTTHDLADAAEADHVLLLAGRVLAQGPPAEVLTADRLSSAYAHRVMAMDGQVMVDDAAHRPSAARHVHLDRSNMTGKRRRG